MTITTTATPYPLIVGTWTAGPSQTIPIKLAITTSELCEMCGGISSATVRRLVKRGKLPKPISKGRYSLEAVRRHLAKGIK